MTILYFDCSSGAAGDMLLGALLDAGASGEKVRSALDALEIPGWDLEVRATTKGGLRALRAIVATDDDATSRTYATIRAIIEQASLDEGVRARALRTFEVLAQAEANIHRVVLEDVHFHEVGGVDAMIDIVGCAAAIESLGATEIVTSPIATGRGWTNSAHGVIPVPAPATLEILKGAPLIERGERELITPTGAAILAGASRSFGPMPPLRLEAIGYGAGSGDLDWPNVVRVLVGSPLPQTGSEAWLIESNIDDMSPELIPHAIGSLLRAGASDAWTTPIVMKKGRPAITLSVLVASEHKDAALDALYRETTTLGARLQQVGKDAIDREWIEVEVDAHLVRVKLGRRGGEVVTVSPEYEDAAGVARATGRPLREVFDRATAAAKARLEGRV